MCVPFLTGGTAHQCIARPKYTRTFRPWQWFPWSWVRQDFLARSISGGWRSLVGVARGFIPRAALAVPVRRDRAGCKAPRYKDLTLARKSWRTLRVEVVVFSCPGDLLEVVLKPWGHGLQAIRGTQKEGFHSTSGCHRPGRTVRDGFETTSNTTTLQARFVLVFVKQPKGLPQCSPGHRPGSRSAKEKPLVKSGSPEGA